MKVCFWVLILLGSISVVSAQRTVTLFYDKDWNITSENKHITRREEKFDCTKLIYFGDYKDYDREGHLMAEGIYHEGIKTGIQKTYFPDGKLKSSIDYKESGFVIHDLFSEYSFKVHAGTGKFLIPITLNKQDGLLIGEFDNYQRTGKW